MAVDYITIETIGVVRVTGSQGDDVTPRGMQTRAILAVLALSPRMTVSRRWLEALFWSDKDAARASGSLRQALAMIRRQLGIYSTILQANRGQVALDVKRVHVDLLDTPVHAYRSLNEGHELLEGTDLTSEGFEDWLRQARAQFHDKAEKGVQAHPAAAILPSAPEAQVNSRVPTLYTSTDGGIGTGALETFMAEAIGAQLSRTSSSHARAEVRLIDGRVVPVVLGPQSQCVIRIGRQGGYFIALLRLTEEPSGRIYWHRQVRFDANDNDAAVDVAAAVALEATEAFVACQENASRASRANAMAASALAHVFSFDPIRLAKGIELLSQANELDAFAPRPALQALAMAFLVLETGGELSSQLRHDTNVLVDASMALDSNNAVALSFLADVHDLVFQDSHTALSFAKCALRRDPGIGYAYASLGALELRRGKAQDAIAAATRAQRQLVNSSLEVFALMRLCVASMSVGDFGPAVRAAERAANLAPLSRPPLRHLYALRLSQNDRPGAYEALSALHRLEPEFSMAMLRENPDFPAATLRSVGFHKLQDIEI